MDVMPPSFSFVYVSDHGVDYNQSLSVERYFQDIGCHPHYSACGILCGDPVVTYSPPAWLESMADGSLLEEDFEKMSLDAPSPTFLCDCHSCFGLPPNLHHESCNLAHEHIPKEFDGSIPASHYLKSYRSAMRAVFSSDEILDATFLEECQALCPDDPINPSIEDMETCPMVRTSSPKKKVVIQNGKRKCPDSPTKDYHKRKHARHG